jgi:hypothetical protein
MKQAHRKVIIAAMAGAGLLVGNMAFGATEYTDYMEYQANGKRPKTHISQKAKLKSHQRQLGKYRE